MPHPPPIGIMREVLALALVGMRQSAIVGHMSLTRATINHVLWRHTATGTLVSGNSTGALQKTTPYQDHALSRMVWQDRLINARTLRCRCGICMELGLAGKQSTSGSCPMVTVLIDCQLPPFCDELGQAIAGMDNPPQNLVDLCRALLDKWTKIPVERLQRLVASMPWRLAAIIAARGGNTRYWTSIHKTTLTALCAKNQVCLTRFSTITILLH